MRNSKCFVVLWITLLALESSGQSLNPLNKVAEEMQVKLSEIVEETKSLKYSKDQVINIEVPAKPQAESKLANITRYIPLETTRDFVISEITQIEQAKDRFYILDKGANSVVIFHSDGKLFKRIHDAGSGPKQYVKLGSIYVSEENNNLVLYDVQRQRFSFYDLDGNLVETKPALYWNHGFSMFPGGEFAYYLTKNYGTSELLLTDLKLFATRKGVDPTSSGFLSFYTHGSYLKDFGDHKLVMPTFRDTLYQFNQDSIFAKYALRYKGNKLPDGYWNNGMDNFLSDYKGYDYSLGDFYENERFAGFSIEHLSSSVQLIYSKKSGNVFYGYLKDKESLLPLFYSGKSMKSTFIINRTPDRLLDFYDENKGKSLGKDFVQLCSTIKRGDNPVVMLFDVEEF